MKQLDFICLECPLKECDEQSLFCALRFLTKPNAAQKDALNMRAPEKRTKYLADYYAKNRKAKRAAALDRYHRKKKESLNVNP